MLFGRSGEDHWGLCYIDTPDSQSSDFVVDSQMTPSKSVSDWLQLGEPVDEIPSDSGACAYAFVPVALRITERPLGSRSGRAPIPGTPGRA